MVIRRLLASFLVLFVFFAWHLPAGAEPPLERFIVVLDPGPDDVVDTATALAGAHGGRLGHVYRHALRGFSIEIPAAAVAGLAADPHVAWVEPDQVVSIASQTIPTGIDRVEGDRNPPSATMDVDIAIIDTGASVHPDLNAYMGTDCTGAILYPLIGGCTGSGNIWDENGHSTHVAGTAAARNNDLGVVGTAPGARLWFVKVLGADGSGYLGSILAGIDTVTAYSAQIDVANMSLGFSGAPSAALNTSITNSVNAGVVYVVAAGNSAVDASGFHPASHPDVITVSALADFDGDPGGSVGNSTVPPYCRVDQDDTLADFSNFGSSVEIAAPGVCIYSTHLSNGYATYSGTSMATPHVTGAVARYLVQTGTKPTNRTQALAVRDAVIAAAHPQSGPCGFSGDPDAYPEPLLFLNGPAFGGDGTCGDAPPPPPNQAPVASYTYSCTDLSCGFNGTGSSDSDGTVVSYAWDFWDGTPAGSGATTTHTYSAGGTYQVTLTVTDNNGATGTQTQPVTVTAPPPPNQPPLASYTYNCTDLSCSFNGTGSSDSDGTVVSYSWNFGDGTPSGSGATTSHTYSAGGTYQVTLTVTDNDGATGTQTQSVTVAPAPTLAVQSVVVSMTSSRRANATVTIVDAFTGLGASGATVRGEWRWTVNGTSGARIRSGTTGTNGVVVLSSGLLPSKFANLQFCVTSVTHLSYASPAGLPVCDSP